MKEATKEEMHHLNTYRLVIDSNTDQADKSDESIDFTPVHLKRKENQSNTK